MTIDGTKLEPLTRTKATTATLRTYLGIMAFYENGGGRACACRIVGLLDDAAVVDAEGDTLKVPYGDLYTAPAKKAAKLYQSCLKTGVGKLNGGRG